MNCDYYRILCGSTIIAERMTIETAVLFIKALFYEYYKDPELRITIEKMGSEYIKVEEKQ